MKNAGPHLPQVPRASYERLSKFPFKNSFKIGKIDTIFFIKTNDKDILVVQIYVDDIIFSATNVSFFSFFFF